MAREYSRRVIEMVIRQEEEAMGIGPNESGSMELCQVGSGRQSAARVLYEQAERFERKAKALRMLGCMVEDLPASEDGFEDPIEPLLWELLVSARWL